MAKLAACNICSSTSFAVGPHGRKSLSGVFPQCANCHSLERHRIIRSVYEQIRSPQWQNWSALQFSEDKCVDRTWFGEFEVSIFGKVNSIDIQNIPKHDGSYDILICNHVLEHVSDDHAALKELGRVVKEDGFVQVTVPSPYHFARTVNWGFPDERRFGHYREYGRDALPFFANALEDFGLISVVGTDPVTEEKDFVFFYSKSRAFFELCISRFEKADVLRDIPAGKGSSNVLVDAVLQSGVAETASTSLPLVKKAISKEDIWQFATNCLQIESSSPTWRYLKTHDARFAVLLNDICDLHLAGSRILDVAGTHFTKSMIEYFCPTSSVTLCDDVDIERDHWGCRYSGYGAVLLTEVIEHLGVDPAFALYQCSQAMENSGILIVTTVNIARHIAVHDLMHGDSPYVMGGVFGKDADRHDREYAPWELADLVAAHGFDVRLSTFDCYERSARQRSAIDRVRAQLGDEMLLHRDTIKVIAKKAADVPGPIRLWPIYHFSVSANRVETLLPGVRDRVTLVDAVQE